MTRISRTSAALPLAVLALLAAACSEQVSTSAAPPVSSKTEEAALPPEPVVDPAPAAVESSSRVIAAAPPAKVSKGFSAATPLKTLLNDPDAKAVLQTHMPMLVRFAPRLPAAVTEQSLQAMAASPQAAERGGLTPDVLRQIDEALAAL